VGFWPSLDRSRFATSGAWDDKALDDPLAHEKQAADQQAGPVLQSMEAAPELADDIEGPLEADFADKDRSGLRRFDLKGLDQVVGQAGQGTNFK